MVGIGNGDKGCQMQHRVAAFHGLLYAVWIPDVPRENLAMRLDVGCAVIEPPPGSEGVVKHKRTDRIALADQRLGEVRPYKTI